jgi:hypothetical protein
MVPLLYRTCLVLFFEFVLHFFVLAIGLDMQHMVYLSCLLEHIISFISMYTESYV